MNNSFPVIKILFEELKTNILHQHNRTELINLMLTYDVFCQNFYESLQFVIFLFTTIWVIA